METFIYQLIENINQFPRWSIFLSAFASGWVQVIFPPYPGEIVLTLCGCIEYNKHIIQSLILFLTYWTGIVTANMALYTLGVYKGEALLKTRLVSRFLTEETKVKIKNWLSKYGFLVFLTAIYIPGMYLPTVFFSGVMKYRRRYAFAGMVIATLIHDILLFLGGRFLGGNLTHVANFITTYRDMSIAVVLGVIALFITYRILIRAKKKLQRQEV